MGAWYFFAMACQAIGENPHAAPKTERRRDLEGHPKVGASWEGFAIQAVMDPLAARPEECFFWATYAGAELDLLIARGRHRRGFEFKRTVAPSVTRSLRSALQDLKLAGIEVIHAGEKTFRLERKVRAVALRRILEARRDRSALA
jgi:hypothetical protein